MSCRRALSSAPRNQARLHVNAMDALARLTGDDWGQHGQAVFFTMGAFRDRNNKLKMFKYVYAPLHRPNLPITPLKHYSISVGPGKIPSFKDSVDEYDTTLRRPFRKWADLVLPGSVFHLLIKQGQPFLLLLQSLNMVLVSRERRLV